MNKFIARYLDDKGLQRSLLFDKSRYNKEQAEEILNKKGIKNFLFFFEPVEPTPFGENGMHFKGEVGFDITMDSLLPYVDMGKEIVIDSFGGDLFEGWKIHDAIKLSGKQPKITVLGTCASSCVQILLSTPNREMTGQSRLLIHNPWTEEMGDDEQFQKTANELRTEKNRLASFYSEISGKSIDDILAIMKEERFMYVDECIAMNFINQTEIKNEEMNAEQEKELKTIGDKVNDTLAVVKNLFIKSVKNLVVQDVNGDGLDFGDEIETVEQIAVGNTATVNGEPANKEHVMPDGVIYVFEAGTLMEIKEAEAEGNDEVEALKQEVEQLKQENEQLQNSYSTKEKEYNDLKANSNTLESNIKDIETKFNEFKNRFSNEKEEIKVPEEKNTGKKSFTYKKK